MIWMPVLVNDINYKLYITYIFIQAHFFGLSEKKSEIWCSSCADHSDPVGGGKSLPRPSPKFSHMEEMKLMALWKSMTIWNFGHIGHTFGYVICLYIFRHAVPRCDSCLVPWPNPINIEKKMCDHLWISRSFQLISIMPFSCWAECWNGEKSSLHPGCLPSTAWRRHEGLLLRAIFNNVTVSAAEGQNTGYISSQASWQSSNMCSSWLVSKFGAWLGVPPRVCDKANNSFDGPRRSTAPPFHHT